MTDYTEHTIFFDENTKLNVQLRKKIFDAVDYQMCFRSPEGEIIETKHRIGAFRDTGEYEDVTQSVMPNVLLGWYENAKEFGLLEFNEGTPIITVALKAQAQNKPFHQDQQLGLYLSSQARTGDQRIEGIYNDYVSWLLRQQIRRLK